MAQESLEQFREVVLQDTILQKQFQETPERDDFIKLVVRLGLERGYSFTSEEVEEALRASRRAWLMRWV